MKNLIEKILTLAIIILVLSASSFSQKRQPEVVSGKNGMIATAHPLASQAALEILKLGGNAVDAAVTAAFVIGVVEPDGSGLGGGGGMLIYLSKEKKSIYINYYQSASSQIDKLEFDRKTESKTIKAALVPGTVAGLTIALEKYGTLPLSTVIAPAIKYAEEGFQIDATLAAIILDNIEVLQTYPATKSIYLPDDFPIMEGDLLVQKDLARTLKAISENGRDGFYKGSIADEMTNAIQFEGGIITSDDLTNYEAEVTTPTTGTYREYQILSAHEPQSGTPIVEALNILENENLNALGHYTQNSETLNLMAETFRRVYADRSAFIEDPRFGYVPVDGLTSKEYAQTRYEDIKKESEEPKDYRKTKPGNPLNFIEELDTLKQKSKEMLELDAHTTHLSVIDKDGNVVSLTQTLGTFFGSGFTTAGVLMNNALMNFSFTSKMNDVEPNKRPRSSIAPTIILKDDKPIIAVGSPGASRIITTVVQMIVNLLDFKMTAEEVNFAPRFFCQKFDDYLYVESRIPQNIIDELKRMGHNVQVLGDYDLFFGGAQLITVDPLTGTYYGSADPRRGGIAVGY